MDEKSPVSHSKPGLNLPPISFRKLAVLRGKFSRLRPLSNFPPCEHSIKFFQYAEVRVELVKKRHSPYPFIEV